MVDKDYEHCGVISSSTGLPQDKEEEEEEEEEEHAALSSFRVISLGGDTPSRDCD